MKLSTHFTLEELTYSQTAEARGFHNAPNTVEQANLTRLAGVLEEVRALAGLPMVITSGFRGLALNAAVGGSKTSAHTQGLAADFSVRGQGVFETCQAIAQSNIQFDQLIYEKGPNGPWVHLGLSTKVPRRQVLSWSSATGYLPGLQRL